MRVFEHRQLWLLESSAYEQAAALFRDTLRQRWQADAVVGITRGGRALAQYLAEHLHLPYYEVQARHNSSDDLYSSTESAVTIDLGQIAAKIPTLFLVDDICGTGATLTAVQERLSAVCACERMITVVLCRNIGSTYMPDVYAWDVNDWVVFPWEPQPTHGDAALLPTLAILQGRHTLEP